MRIYTLKELKEEHFDYFGYHWCQSVLTIGDVSNISNDLQLVCKEMNLNLLKCQLDYRHFEEKKFAYSSDIEVLNYFCAVINPDNLPEKIIKDIRNIWEERLIVFLKKPDFMDTEKDNILIKTDADFDFFKMEFLKILMNEFGSPYLFEPVGKVVYKQA